MATLIKEILASAFALADNPTEEELSYITAMEQYAVVASEMQNEKILGYRNTSISKTSVTFSDNTGIVNDTLTDFVEDVVFLQFNQQSVEEVPVNMLDLFRNIGQQAVAFYDEVTGSSGSRVSTKKIALALKVTGTLEVWYEPRPTVNRAETDNIELEDSYKQMMATRLASYLLGYVHFKDPMKQANRPMLMVRLEKQANYAKDLYKEKVNRIGAGNRPYSRLPFTAG